MLRRRIFPHKLSVAGNMSHLQGNIVTEHEPISKLVLILCATLISLVAYTLWFRSLRYFKLGNQIPGPLPLPIVGNALMAIGLSPKDILHSIWTYYQTIHKKDVGRFWMGPKLYVALADVKDVEIIIGSNVHLEKSEDYRLFEPWLGEGLLISKGEKWKSHRKMIVPTFHTSILKSFMSVFNKNGNKLVESFRKEIGKSFDVHDYMSETTVDTLLETAMGVNKSNVDNTGYDYAMAVMKMCKILHLRHTKIWLRPDLFFNFTSLRSRQTYLLNIIHGLTSQVLKRKKVDYCKRIQKGQRSLYEEAMSEAKYSEENDTAEDIMSNYVRDDLEEVDNDIGEKKRLAFLDFMIEASHSRDNNMTDDEIREEVDTIMFEGHDTTASASSFVLSVLGTHQDVQDKVFEELKEIFQDDLSRPITFNDTVNMKYLERVILETIRLYPPVPVISRRVNEDTKLVSGDYTIPAGTTVVIAIFAVHRSPKYYTNPEKFDPDNFLPDRCQNRPYYAFIPFSAGPRSCVGRKYAMLKLKVLLASILRKYKTISTIDESEYKLQGDIILKREEGFQIKVEER